MKSLSKNGVSTCVVAGQENYVSFHPCHRQKETFYQYDYRHHSDGTLFSCIKPTLEECRNKRDEWLQKKQEGRK